MAWSTQCRRLGFRSRIFALFRTPNGTEEAVRSTSQGSASFVRQDPGSSGLPPCACLPQKGAY